MNDIPCETRNPSLDETYMRVALDLARRGEGHVEPNPMVGCVLVRGNQIIGQGYHERFGGPHAEANAIAGLTSDAKDATAYVTLEPCCHHGKTPPCATALIKAGVSRVVVAVQDPFAQVNGGGLGQLRAAGITTQVGVLADESSQLLAPYIKRVRTGRPWVIAKWAMTMDGRTATVNGESQWITNETSRSHVHRLRGRVDAVIAGMGTVATDDPMLNARPPGPRSAKRVVFCQNRLPSVKSKLIQTANQFPVLIVAGSSIDAQTVQPLCELGAEVFHCNIADRLGMVQSALDQFGELEMTNVMIEGGGELLGSFLQAGEIDECHTYIGSKMFGGAAAPGPIGGPGLLRVVDGPAFRVQSMDCFGDDIRVIYRSANGN